MVGIRRALAIATVERYFGLVANFALTVVVSRLLTPEEVGIWAIGLAAVTLIAAVREFATGTYLIQKADLTPAEIRGAATVMLLISALVGSALIVLAPWLAGLYGDPRLVAYLRVAACGVFLEVISILLTALMRRDMAFVEVAVVSTAGVAAFVGVTIALASLGFSYMSFAWAWIASSALSALLALLFRPDLSVFWPLLRHWRGVLTFGACNGTNVFLYRFYEAVPTMVLGSLASIGAAGLFSRAQLVCQLPDKVLLGGVSAVILPALSAEVRAGRGVKEPYLQALSLTTVLQWPLLVVVTILAHPVVLILLGDQWLGAVALVHIVAPALMLSSANELNYPILISIGAIRDVLLRGLIIWPISALIIAAAAAFGVHAAALGLLVVVPFQAFVSICFVRRRVPIEWRDLATATWRSGIVALVSATGPICMVASLGLRFDLSVWQGVGAGVLALAGWFAGVWLTRHPVLAELEQVRRSLRRLLGGPHMQQGRVP
jgi:O-antigen/teichoic acid export membrane protein